MAEEVQTPAGRYTGETTVPVDATSILLLRDGDAGLEVLLLERHLDSDFAGGAYVFPGGKVDVADRQLNPARWSGRDPAAWRDRIGAADDAAALGLFVSAIRETFEEAGVLLARRDGAALTDADLSDPAFIDARRRLASRDERWDWRPWLAEQNLTLDLGSLAFWSWWCTPDGQHKRFDTRFFVAVVPPEQSAAHDTVEMTASRWVRPQAALQAAAEGRVNIIFPTRRNLEALAAYPDARSAWQAAADGVVDQRRIQPTVVIVDGQVMVQHPYEDEPSPI